MIITPARVYLPLRAVPDCAFYDCTSLERAEFEHAEIIGSEVFCRSSLTHCTFGNVRMISAYAFAGCPFKPEVTP